MTDRLWSITMTLQATEEEAHQALDRMMTACCGSRIARWFPVWIARWHRCKTLTFGMLRELDENGDEIEGE